VSTAGKKKKKPSVRNGHDVHNIILPKDHQSNFNWVTAETKRAVIRPAGGRGGDKVQRKPRTVRRKGRKRPRKFYDLVHWRKPSGRKRFEKTEKALVMLGL